MDDSEENILTLTSEPIYCITQLKYDQYYRSRPIYSRFHTSALLLFVTAVIIIS